MILIICLLVSYVISLGLVPLVITLVRKFDLMDRPDHRKLHKAPTPSMGGLGVIASMFITITMSMFLMDTLEWLLIVTSLIGFSVMGFIDDWKDLNAKLKLVVQIGLSVTAYLLGFKLDYGFGLFGIQEITPIISFVLTIGIYILLINAYNLIDGIDELAGGILSINFAAFAVVFFMIDRFDYMLLSVIGFGAVRGFMKFNAHPARIFMGDSGSLPLGMIMALLTFKALQVLKPATIMHTETSWVLPTIIALNCIPLFDTLRVFTIRILKGRSPFSADRIHLHHLFLKNRFGHKKSAMIIHVSHMSIILTVAVFASSMYLWVSVLVVLVLTTFAFELNTFFRLRNRSIEKKSLKEQENHFLKSNKLLVTLKK